MLPAATKDRERSARVVGGNRAGGNGRKKKGVGEGIMGGRPARLAGGADGRW